MSNVSTMVGTVIDGIPVDFKTVHNERFKKIVVDFGGVSIPVVYSEYINNASEIIGKISVTGCLASNVKRNEYPSFFFYANTLEAADEDAESSNIISFELKVTKSKGFQQNSNSRDILPLICSTGNPVKGRSVIYLCLMNSAARKFKDKPVGYIIKGTGELRAFRDVYEIYAVSADVKEE